MNLAVPICKLAGRHGREHARDNDGMTTYFITRHPGALEWAVRHRIDIDVHVAHLDASMIGAGDTIIGTLPVNLASTVCERGAHYRHLLLELPESFRGRELTADELDALGARIETYDIRKVQE